MLSKAFVLDFGSEDVARLTLATRRRESLCRNAAQGRISVAESLGFHVAECRPRLLLDAVIRRPSLKCAGGHLQSRFIGFLLWLHAELFWKIDRGAVGPQAWQVSTVNSASKESYSE